MIAMSKYSEGVAIYRPQNSDHLELLSLKLNEYEEREQKLPAALLGWLLDIEKNLQGELTPDKARKILHTVYGDNAEGNSVYLEKAYDNIHDYAVPGAGIKELRKSFRVAV